MTWNACLVRIQRKGKFESFLVTSDKFTVGRSPECDFVVADNQVSRKHLGVLIRSGQIYLKDLNSANGCKMGTTKIPADNVIPYQAGEGIRLGMADFTVYLEYVEKKIEAKDLNDSELPEEEARKVLYFLETSQKRTKTLFDEYETLIHDFKQYSKAETQRLISEAQLKSEKIVTESDLQAKNHLAAIENECRRLIAVTQIESQNLLKAAEINKQQIVTQTDELEKQMLSEARQKAEELSTNLHKDAIEKVQAIISSAESTAKQLRQDAESTVERIVSETTMKSEQTKSQAESNAQQLTAEANAKAQQVLADANKRAQQILSEAESTAKKSLVEMTTKSQQILEDAETQTQKIRTEAELTLSEANAKAQQLASEAQEKSHQLLHQSEVTAKQLISEAQERSSQLLEQSETRAQQLVAEAQSKAKTLSTESQEKSHSVLSLAESRAQHLTEESERTAQKLLKDVQLQVDSLYEKFENHKKDEISRMNREQEQYKTQVLLTSKLEQDKLKETYDIKMKMFEDECAIRRKHLERDLESQVEKLKSLKLEEESWQQKIATLAKEQLELARAYESQQSQKEILKKSYAELQNQLSEHQEILDVVKNDKTKLDAEILEAVKTRESENTKIHNLRRQIKEEKAHLEEEIQAGRGRIQTELSAVREKESKDIQRIRIEELQKIETLRNKALEEIVQNKAIFKLKLAEKLQGLFVALHKQANDDLNLPALKTEIFNMVQGAVEEQSFDITQKHEGDIRHLVKEETQKRKSIARRLGLAISAVAAAAAGIYILNGGEFSHILQGKNLQGETAAEEFGRQQREVRESKKFEPLQSDFIKSSYTDNILYTRNYFSVYTNPQIQEQWISLLNGLFSKQFHLDDDAIVKFVAAESTLVTTLQQEKDQVIPDFANIGIDKMRKIEKESTQIMKDILKSPAQQRKFQSISEKFWHERLLERLPASN
jgi:vacuolar-type H+-ATPase subunit H